MINTYNMRIAQLRRHRDRYMRNARHLKVAIEHETLRCRQFDMRMALVRLVVKARCNNHSMLMWARLRDC
jgi:hypothetical protein